MYTDKVIKIGFVINAILLIITIGFVFLSLYSTLNGVYTGGDDSAFFQQLYYNQYNGRPFQTSIIGYENPQFINPHAYINVLVYHGYFWNYIFGIPYLFIEDAGLSIWFILVINVLGCAVVSFFIIRKQHSEDHIIKWLLFIIILISSGFLHYCIPTKGIPSLIIPPLVLLAYLFFIDSKKYLFNIVAILTCLLQDDLSTFVSTAGIYIFFVIPEKRSYSYFPIIFGISYFMIWNFITPHFTRADLIPLASSSMLLGRLQDLFESISNANFGNAKQFFLGYVHSVIYSLHTFVVFSAASILLYFKFKRTEINYIKIVLFLVIVPLPYWVYNLMGFVVRHSITINSVGILFFLFILDKIEIPKKLAWHTIVPFMMLFPLQIIIHIFTLDIIPFVVSTYNKPNHVREYIKDKTLGFWEEQAEYDKLDGYKLQMVSNKSVIEIVDKIPKQKTLSIWINHSLHNFVTFRNDLWRFPMYYNQTDFLLIQKNAESGLFQVENLEGLNYTSDSIRTAGQKIAVREGFYSGKMSNMIVPIKHLLVDSLQTHKIAQETEHLLLLERKEHFEIPMPASTVGFGWLLKNNSMIKNK